MSVVRHRPLCTVASAAATALAASLLAACQTAPPAPPVPPTAPDVVGEFRKGSGQLNGYLSARELPDSKALLGPPPAAGSPAAAADLSAHEAAKALRAGARGAQAARDAPYHWPHAADTFACELGLPVSEAATPHLYTLLRRTLVDAGLSTYGVKDQYQRQRPYVALKENTCFAPEEARLAKDGSYPSGHSAFGWAWALILAELAPDRQAALLRRGLDFGTSRSVCGYHWASDVEAGRVMGAATVARLHANPVFTAQAALARGEIERARAAGATAPAFCAAQGR